ncbi:hypothetical protein V2J09_015225 [Rumex salicifolius]
MDSPQSVVSPFKNLSVTGETEKPNSEVYVQKSGCQRKEPNVFKTRDDSIGFLDVHIHQARDIHNICIYHKQDVYAKICLTSDPDNTVATQTINGGGRNPVFNESLRIDVGTIETSLKCEIWMLSRVRNYLEDQLLGFALVPLSDVLVSNGEIEKEFSLSSTDLYHSPAGFVQLSLKYSGSSPEVMVISKLPKADRISVEESEQETSEYDKLEFPDPNIANENQMMVTEYIGINGSSMDTQSTQSHVSSETENQFSSETVIHAEESFSANSPISSQSSETPVVPPKSPNQEEHISPLKEKEEKKNDDFTAEHNPDEEKKGDTGNTEKSEENGLPKEAVFNPVVSIISVKPPEEKVVQQDYVDMYMKSMQQFTDSLAKMKLPMDLETSTTKSENSSSSDATAQTPKTPGVLRSLTSEWSCSIMCLSVKYLRLAWFHATSMPSSWSKARYTFLTAPEPSSSLYRPYLPVGSTSSNSSESMSDVSNSSLAI